MLYGGGVLLLVFLGELVSLPMVWMILVNVNYANL